MWFGNSCVKGLRVHGLTSVRRFALGGEDDEAETLDVFAVERDVERLVVQSAGHRQAR